MCHRANLAVLLSVCWAFLPGTGRGAESAKDAISPTGASKKASDGSGDWAAVPVVAEMRLARGEKKTFHFDVPKPPPGRDLVLVLRTRLDTPKPAGYTQALRLVLGGKPLGADRLVNKPLRVRTQSGRVASMAAGQRLTVFYSPDFESPDDHPNYGLLGDVKACEFALRVTDLLERGTNELVVQNSAHPSVTRVLVVADARIEFRESPPPQKSRTGAPTGPLPLIEPQTTFHTDYRAETRPDARIEVAVGPERFVVESRFSTPKPGWIHGTNQFFRHERRVEPKPEVVLVFDTFTNLTSENLALMYRHEVCLGDRLRRVWLTGLELPTAAGRISDASNPTAFAATTSAGVGLIALDDVFHLHVNSGASEGCVGIDDRNFVLKPKAAHTVQWAIIPTDAPDYWRFLNAARRLLDANFTIPGGFAFMRASHHTESWTDAQTRDFIRLKDARYVCASIGRYRGRYAHGTAFQHVPHEPYQEAFARRRLLAPGVQNLVYFHCFLDTTDEAPERFADARTLRADGQQADYGMPHQRLFFPTESNSYGPAIARNVDIILDKIKAEGVYWDEHEYSARAYHYGEPWDGVSGDIDPKAMTVRRLKSSVTLVTEPWRVAMARRILARGPLVGNGVPRTRAMAALRFPCFVETGSISNCTRAQLYSPIALGDHLTERSEEDAYQTMLAALDYGCVYHWYNDLTVVPSHHHLTRYMYPITPLELHEGYVIGRERILTKKSGLFGWGDKSRHEVHVFDHRGREVAEYATPQVEHEHKTYTELRLPEGWSAAVVRK